MALNDPKSESPAPNLAFAVPSTPDPTIVTLVAALLRHLMTLLAGVGIPVGVASDSTLMIIASAILGLASVAWALYQKFSEAIKAHQNAKASAILNQPVKV